MTRQSRGCQKNQQYPQGHLPPICKPVNGNGYMEHNGRHLHFRCINGEAVLALRGFQNILNYLYFGTTGLFTLVMVKQAIPMEMNSYTLDPNQWLEKYGEMMYQYILPRVGDSELAQDLVQDTFFLV